MEHPFIGFLVAAIFGVVGVGMVLVRLLETILSDWDAVSDLREWLAPTFKRVWHP